MFTYPFELGLDLGDGGDGRVGGRKAVDEEAGQGAERGEALNEAWAF